MLRRRMPTRGAGRRPLPTLADEAAQAALERDGYVVVDLLDAPAIARILRIRKDLGIAPGDPRVGLFSDVYSTDRTYKRAMSQALHAELAAPNARVFHQQRTLAWSTLVKWPGEAGTVIAHRDPTFVDEHRFRSVGVWCALDDIGEDEGTLYVVPGSHRFDGTERAHQASDNLHERVVGVDRSEVTVPLRAGQAIVYYHSLIHGSDPNTGPRERVVVAGVVVPSSAVPRYTLVTGAEAVCSVEIGPDFFIDHQLDRLDVDAVLRTHRRVEPTGRSQVG